MDNVCKLCKGTIEEIETEDGNVVKVCVCCGCPNDCEKKEGEK